ncbi:hypothetical protein [Rhodoferax saidenbachensis]|uniref:Rho-binding antiterminator n=1 Tax=Rhodoferax saidenbachensis TaxID=1484693 RepID=A0A1P8KB48_9BURK|nr:hypothetical protein [Rhodoferax saidenbachensis]APW43195.1 hypothetical protein RS694_12110 [Rhodoferax saidenbachensis]
MTTYTPINCEFHDVIESTITRRQPVTLVVMDAVGDVQTLHDKVTDVFAKEGAEYLVTESGQTIRLDQLQSIGGHDKSDFG